VLGKIAPSMACIMPERLAATPPTKAITEVVGSGPFRFVANERVPGSRVVYERFQGYVPRPGAEPPGQTSGPKHVYLDRVEWITMPEAGTAAAALRTNEVDWWEVPPPDLLPMLRGDRNLVVEVYDKTGVMPVLRLNCLQPPFDNRAIRHAVLQAASQRDFMQAFSNDPAMWKERVGLFTPGTPMATDAGLDAFANPDLLAARRAIADAGYANQRVVVMQPADHPVNNTMAQVGADLMKQIGLNVDIQAMDAGTMFQRRANRESVDKGGWSVFPSMVGGADTLTPAVSFLTRGNGADAWYGWPTIPKLEAARAAWFDAPDLTAQRALCAEMQRAVLDSTPHIHLGQILQPTAIRTGITGVLDGIPKFWNVRKA
jgi:peptide/nickel transport system substrate-binding protein